MTIEICLAVDQRGRFGSLSNFMPASSGVRRPFLRLQARQEITRLVQESSPPRERGYVIDVELAVTGAPHAVLTLEVVTQQQVFTRQPNLCAWRPLVTQQVQDTRHAQRAADNRQRVVGMAYGQAAPERKVIGVTRGVYRMAHPAIEQHHGATRCGDAHRCEEAIEQENRQVQNIAPAIRVSSDCSFQSVH